ncbi:MAG: L-fucose mutarotase [Verrucomicrobiales bacterium]|jgi:L-fucose mutarotase
MLKGISPLISPDLIEVLYRMGHGDMIVFADAHFPAESLGPRVVRADGLKIAALLDAVLPLFEIDSYSKAPILMMSAVEGDEIDPEVPTSYRAVIEKHAPAAPATAQHERFAFYDIARGAYAVVATGDTAKYGNIILQKGVTPA